MKPMMEPDISVVQQSPKLSAEISIFTSGSQSTLAFY